ncbi:ATP-binding cassette domain-containing protein [Plantactinospora sonchi]|uniref:ATP-binding cassette domain-containing protein n=1 Tax=Plantactinospora sonchi TaxID=1544735 RepID=A0ABU7S455_9ACTN
MNVTTTVPLAVRTRGLRRTYGERTAVHGLDLAVPEGETFGFLGPNGAGKSTTIAMLCTLLRPTAGTAEVAGADVRRTPWEVRRRIGVVFQEPTVDRDLTAEENLRLHAELYGVPRRELRSRSRYLLGLLGLDRVGTPVGAFSGGMRRRLELARSLMHRPRVLFLDEPTVGLDPQSRAAIWEHLHGLREQQPVTLFLTTHHMEEAERCDRIVVMDQGRVVAQGTPRQLKAELGADVVHLRTADDRGVAATLRAEAGLDVGCGPDGVRVSVADGAALVPRLCAGLTTPVYSVTVTRPSLDDVFLHHTGRTIRDAGAAPASAEVSAVTS